MSMINIRPSRPFMMSCAVVAAVLTATAAGLQSSQNNVPAGASLPGMATLNIGFSIVSRALFVGLEAATREMNALVATN